MTRAVGIYIFDEVEVLDFAGPYEVFSTASRVYCRLHPEEEAPFRVFTVAAEKKMILARAGLKVTPEFDFDDHPPIDVLILPGGPIQRELERPSLIRWIQGIAASASLVASVCTGAFILAKTGLLDGRRATTHWENLDGLKAMFPEVELKPGARWVEEGNIFTAAGISAGIDMSLRIVAVMEGIELARRTARQMEYRWTEEP